MGSPLRFCLPDLSINERHRPAHLARAPPGRRRLARGAGALPLASAARALAGAGAGVGRPWGARSADGRLLLAHPADARHLAAAEWRRLQFLLLPALSFRG